MNKQLNISDKILDYIIDVIKENTGKIKENTDVLRQAECDGIDESALREQISISRRNALLIVVNNGLLDIYKDVYQFRKKMIDDEIQSPDKITEKFSQTIIHEKIQQNIRDKKFLKKLLNDYAEAELYEKCKDIYDLILSLD